MSDVKNPEVIAIDISAATPTETSGNSTDTGNPDTNDAGKEKQLCEGATCPAVQNRKILSLREGLADLDKVLASLRGVCAGPSCPFGQKSSISGQPNTNNNARTSSQSTNHCGGQTCPAEDPGQKKRDTSVFQSAARSNYNNEPCPLTSKFTFPSAKPDWNVNGPVPCGGYTCPYTSTSLQKPTTASYTFPTDLNNGLCGTAPCPYSAQEYPPKPDTPINDVPSQVLNCGRPTCPFNVMNQSNLSTGMATGIFPYGNGNQREDKRYHCGSPSCTNLDPSSMVYTHYYANDYGFVQESSRPYCGSSCPYDYLSSINNQYPSALASNYPTFESAKHFGSMPCPHLSKQTALQRRKVHDTMEEGICGADKDHSCDHPDVEKCESPDCKVTQRNMDLNNFEFCEDCGGVKGEKIYVQNSNPIVQSVEENRLPGKSDETREKPIREKSAPLITYKANDIVTETKVATANTDTDENGMKVTLKKSAKESPVLYTYPGVQIGHKECLLEKKLVPGHMGWLWNILPEGNKELWRGYKPGAISKTVHRMMRAQKKYLNILDSSSDVIRKKKSKAKILKPEDMKHCLEVKKKDGDYFVTVNPVRDPVTVNPADNPFMDVTPMQFKIEKEKKGPEEAYCPCDEVSVKTYDSSEGSELELLFSPPAALPPISVKKKKHMHEIDTQYDVNDLPAEFRASTKAIKGKKGGGKGEKKGGKDAKGKGNKGGKGKKKK